MSNTKHVKPGEDTTAGKGSTGSHRKSMPPRKSQSKSKKQFKIAKIPSKPTQSARHHHFESFSARVARIHVDPIRRLTVRAPEDADLSASASYFKSGLEEWKENCLTEKFSQFAREVTPLCESLAQVVYHEEKIAELLITSLGDTSGTKDTLEPLLALVPAFARDEGVRVEKFFARIVTALKQLAFDDDVRVVEWTFSSLAFLFKYLWKVLVDDLRPLLGIMLPLMGKQKVPYYLPRLTAESLSFLLRKASTVYSISPSPLRDSLTFLLDDLKDSVDTQSLGDYEEGLVSLLEDSIKGVQAGVHSGGSAVLQETLTLSLERWPHLLPTAQQSLVRILSGTFVRLKTTKAEPFEPLLATILQVLESRSANTQRTGVYLSARLLFVLIGTRSKRIKDFTAVISTIGTLIASISDQDTDAGGARRLLLQTLATTLHHYSGDVPVNTNGLQKKVSEILSQSGQRHTLEFVVYLGELDNRTFQRWGHKLLEAYITRWDIELEDALLFAIARLGRNGNLAPHHTDSRSKFHDRIFQRLHLLAHLYTDIPNSTDPLPDEHEALVYQCHSLLQSYFTAKPEGDELDDVTPLKTILVRSWSVQAARYPILQTFGLGFCFKSLVGQQPHFLTAADWPTIARLSAGRNEPFWAGIREFLDVHSGTDPGFELPLEGSHLTTVSEAFFHILASPSSRLRATAVEILRTLALPTSAEPAIARIFALAADIETTPHDFENYRDVQRMVREIAQTYQDSTVRSNKWLSRALPTLCFGYLHIPLAPVIEEVCAGLKEMSRFEPGAAVIETLALEWLQHPAEILPLRTETPESNSDTHAAVAYDDPDLVRLDAAFASVRHDVFKTPLQMRNAFQTEHTPIRTRTTKSRLQALRVLHTIPELAERRSRLIVPILLESEMHAEDVVEEESTGESPVVEGDVTTKAHAWSRQDREELYSLFGKFRNPKTLFRSDDVRKLFLDLLTSGDSKVQRLALEVILTYKEPGIVSYKEHLLSLLDNAKFRDELTIFLGAGESEGQIHGDDRPTVVPVIMRLLHGRLITKHVSSGRGNEQSSRRKAVFSVMGRFRPSEVDEYLHVLLGPLHKVSVLPTELSNPGLPDVKRQLGLLNMIKDLLETIGHQFTSSVHKLIEPILYLLFASFKAMREIRETVHAADNDTEERPHASSSAGKAVRQLGLQCLTKLFEVVPHQCQPYVAIILESIITPQLATIIKDASQGVSSLLRLFSVWSANESLASNLGHDSDLFPTLSLCLANSDTVPEVKLFVLNSILKNLTNLATASQARSESQEASSASLLRQHSDTFLTRIGEVLQSSPTLELLEGSVESIRTLLPYIRSTAESRKYVSIAVALLRRQSNTKVRLRWFTKSAIFSTVKDFIPRCAFDTFDDLASNVYQVTAEHFDFFTDRETRALLCDIIQELSPLDESLVAIASLCSDINSFSTGRLGEPDFGRRSQAFGTINDSLHHNLSIRQWYPLVCNALYYIRDEDELLLRANASLLLRRLIEASTRQAPEDKSEPWGLELLVHVRTSIEATLAHKDGENASDLVRADSLAIIAHAVRLLPSWPAIIDLTGLLVDNDEEASVFANLLHTQQHRRQRALRRLAAEAKERKFSAHNADQLFIPLLEHFIFDKKGDEGSQNVAAEAMDTVAALMRCVTWQRFRKRFKSYMDLLKKDDDEQISMKRRIRLVGVVADTLTACVKEQRQDDLTQNGVQVPEQDQLSALLKLSFLPPLEQYIKFKDEAVVSLRIPVALTTVKLFRLLEEEEFTFRFPALLLDICAILRSKDEGARESTRKVLGDIVNLEGVGPRYFGFVLKELRTGLTRGSQRHVLAYTVHSVLVALSDTLRSGDLDYCLIDIVEVVMEDIFGAVGREKTAEGYTGKSKEVKSSKSFDTMEIISKTATSPHLGDLIQPIQELFLSKLNSKTMAQIDNLLKRVASGVSRNEALHGRDILVLCYELATKKTLNNRLARLAPPPRMKAIGAEDTGPTKAEQEAANRYAKKMIPFSLDLLRSLLNTHPELQNQHNLAGFFPVIREAATQGHSDEKLAAFRLLALLTRVPSTQLEADATVMAPAAVKSMKSESSIATELSQAALKYVTTVLREKRSAGVVKESHVADLMKMMKTDLDQPDKQGILFSFLRAVLSAKIVITEVYEIMDIVASIMITSHERSARELARGSYFQFLMEYPQAKGRFVKQINFLVKNLQYEHTDGRKSVMEVMNLLLVKLGDALVGEVLDVIFLPLVLVLYNDDSSECREIATALIKQVFTRADAERRSVFTQQLRTWLTGDAESAYKRLAMQCWGLYFEAVAPKEADVRTVVASVAEVLEAASNLNGQETNWDLLFFALNTFKQVCKVFPAIAFAKRAEPTWTSIRKCLVYPHAWVKLTASELVGAWFADIRHVELKNIPLPATNGLLLGREGMLDIMFAHLSSLRNSMLTEDLAAQAARNLLFLARCFDADGLRMDPKSSTRADLEEKIDNANDDDEEADEEAAEDEDDEVDGQPVLHYMIYKLSLLLRTRPGSKEPSALFGRTASLSLFAALIKTLATSSLQPMLHNLVLPLHRFTDPAIPVPYSTDESFNTAYKSLQENSRELMEVLSNKVGAPTFLKMLQEVQRTVQKKREQNSAKRKIDELMNPAKVEGRKRKKQEKKHEHRKEKSKGYQGKRRGW